ncbi:MAG: polysaccharide deacetylase family protein [Alicyclobacillus sp.]|nr:polysaccharide deacetylase family protein [Alicyclobacillus sp.]
MIRQIPASEQILFLTFDDGPDDEYTPEVLDILRHYGVPAVFFCLGSQAETHPNVLVRMAEEGHTVGNHSWDHPFLTKLPPEEVVRQLESTSASIEAKIGRRPILFRPPYGDVNERVVQQASELGYQTVLWSVDSVDWSGIPGPEVAANAISRLCPGGIMLHHSAGNVAGTVAALPYVIEVARKLGYRFERLVDYVMKLDE